MIQEMLKNRYNLTNYQIAVLKFTIKTLSSEVSKFLIMLLLFHKELPLFFTSMLLLCLIRSTAGGFHCNTYIGCLFCSVTYMFLCIKILPMISINTTVAVFAVPCCILINFTLAPVSSEKHLELSNDAKRRFKFISTFILGIYFLIMVVIPVNPYTVTGFWVIILHTVQLCVAGVQKKICASTAQERRTT
jgi:accessory gene regulator B